MKKIISSMLAVLSIVSSFYLCTGQLNAVQKDNIVPSNTTVTRYYLKIVKNVLAIAVPVIIATAVFGKPPKKLDKKNNDSESKAQPQNNSLHVTNNT